MKPLLNWGILILSCLNFYNASAQISLTNTSAAVPATLDVCGGSEIFTYTIDNVSNFTLQNNEVVFNLPSGMLYVPGSILGCTEVDISNLSQPVFSFPDFTPTDPSVVITFEATVGCEGITFLQSGGTFQNDYSHTYDYGTGQSNTEITTSGTYNVDYPFLLISNVTNQSYPANSGDTYSQCVTITNSGQAPLSDLWFVNAHGSDLSTANYAPGIVVSSGLDFDSVYVDGAQFLGVGNGDLFLDPGESVIVCYDVTVNGCDFVSSNFTTSWGCNGEFCQESGSTANVTFPNLIPDLEFTVTQNTNDACLGNADTFSITIENNGSGTANNVLVDIFNHANGNQTNAYQGYLVPGSFTYTVNGVASVVPTLNTNAFNNVFSCVPANSPSDVTVTIPAINAGDIVVITFEHFLCCPDVCNGAQNIPGLGFEAVYENICGFAYEQPYVQIYNYDRAYATIFNDSSPFHTFGGQTTLMNFGLNPAGNWMPIGTGASYIAEYTLPPCGTWDGQSFFTNWNDVNVFPDSTIVNGITVTSYYSTPLSILQGVFHVGFTLDCDPTSGCMEYIDSMQIPCIGIVEDGWVPENPLDVTMHLFYSPESACGCIVDMCSLTIPIILDCPPNGQITPTDAIVCQDFEFKRTSYGLPDNNNDGQPDAGPLDLTLIKTDRAVYGDTLSATGFGIIDTINGNANYQYFLAKMDIVEGVNITAIGGQIEVYDDNNGVYFTENVVLPAVTTNGVDRYFEFELDATTFVNAPANFLFEQDDTIRVEIDYRVTLNPGNSIDILEVTNYFFATNNPVAVDTTGACKCQDLLNLYGYYFTLWAPNTLYPTECDSIRLTENYYLSVGPCCSNYAGGNAFRYEYRNFATLDTMEIVLPVGYYYSSARIRERRTTGNFASVWSAWQNITPTANIAPVWPNQAGGNHYKFATNQLYTNGDFLYPDGGFYGTLEVYVTPSCEVEQGVENDIGYIADFDTDTLWWDSPTAATIQDITRDIVNYEGAELFIQATLPYIQSQSNQATWTITVQNTSNVNGSNIFLGLDNISGNLNVSSIYHVNTNTTIPNNGGNIFPVGDIPVGAVWEFDITADIDACGLDSIQVYAGWNCLGAPADLPSYPCLNTTPSIVLSVLPLTPLFVTQVTIPNDSLSLCDVSPMTIEGENIQLGRAYDVDLTVTLPTGMSIVPGSAVACFPAGSGNCVPISDPVGIGNSQVLWDSLVFNTVLGLNGFPGFDSTNTIEVIFDITTGCDYTSGSQVNASYQGYAGCGDQTGEEYGSSPPIYILGATVPFEAQIYLESSSLSPCEDSTLLEVWVSNVGSTNFGTSDSVTVILPDGFYYVPGSTVNINTGPTNLTPSITSVGTETYLSWPIPSVVAGDSTHFSLYYQGNPSLLQCEALEISAYSTTLNDLFCISTGQNCSINTIVADTSTFVFVYKGFLELLNGSGVANLGPGNNETVDISFDIYNFGNVISSSYPTTINYYSDANNNGQLDPLDLLIISETYNVLLDSNSIATVTDTILVPSGSGCQIFVELLADENDCSCLSDTIMIVTELELNYPDTTVCANVPMVLGGPIPAGYSQVWLTLDPAESGALSSMAGPMPTVLWTPNPPNVPDTIDIEISTDRGGCFDFDTIQLVVYPQVLVDAGQDTTICHDSGAINLDGSLIGYSDSTYWTQISGPSVLSFSDETDTLSSVTGFVAGTYELVLTGVSAFCLSHTDTVIVTALEVDLSELALTNVSCFDFADGEIQLEAINGVAPYMFSVNGGAYAANTVYNALDTGSYTFVVQDFIGCSDTIVSTITQPDELTLSLTGTNVTCSGFLDGSVTSNSTGGVTPYSYAWSNAAVTPDIFGLDSGQYVLIITDDNGCTISDSVILTSPPPVLVDAGADDSLCHYDVYNLNGAIISFVDSIAWEQASGPSALTITDINDLNTSVSGFVGGVYEMVLHGYNDICPGHTDTVTLTVFDVDLSEQSLTNVSCFGFADGEIQLDAINGVNPYTFSVNGGAYTANTVYSALDTGSYTFVVQDFIGCSDTIVSTITQPDELTLSLTGTNVTCSGFLDGSVTSNSTGGVTPYSYAWSNGAVTPDIFGLDSGQYVLIITDDNGCTISNSVILTSPPPVLVDAGADDSLCHYDVYNLNGAIISFVDSIAWEQASGPSALTITDINDLNSSVSGFVGGVYEMVLHGYNDICPGHSDTVVITSFDPQINQLSLSNVSCFNVMDGEVNVAGANGLIPYLYSMNGGAFTPTTNYPSLDTGSYEFIIQDDFGCVDTLVSLITQPDSIEIVFNRTDVSCFGLTDGAIDATISGGTPMYTFSWSNGQTTQNATGLAAGWHILTVTDGNGCIAVDSIELLAPPPLNLTATIDSVMCNGNSDGNIDVLVTGGTINYNYAWTGGVVTEDLIGYPAGIYDLVVTDGNGCTISGSYEIFEPDPLDYSVSITHESCEDLCDGEIELTSITGGTGSYSIILNGVDQLGNQLFTDLCSGNYTIEVKDENGCSLSTIEIVNPGLPYADASFTVASSLCAYDTTVTIVAVDPSGTWTANGIATILDINPSDWGPGIYDIEHIIPGTCPDTSNQTLTINEIPVPNIWADQLTVCNPDVITLNNLGTPGVNCLWDINGWTSSNCGPITFGTSQDGYFDVELTVTDANGCTATQSIVDYLYFSNSPIADFYTDPGSTVSYYDPTISFVNTSLDAVSYEWFVNGSVFSTNENTSYTNPTGLPGSYAVTLVATDQYGCTDTVTTVINYQDEPVLYVPNTFTPDGNSLNNTFFPVGNAVEITEWIIFDRWGEVIFVSNTIDAEWDGTYNGALVQDGIYTWKITYLSENSGTPITLVGHVNVLK